MSTKEFSGRIGPRRGVASRAATWLLVAYPFAWIALFVLSSNAWFLPAGLRMAALWLLPRRRWPLLALAEWAGIGAITPFSGVHERLAPQILGVFLPWLVYAGVTHVAIRYFGVQRARGRPDTLVRLLACGFVAATLNGLVLVTLHTMDKGLADHLLEAIFVYGFGDYAGIVALSPLILIAHEQSWDPVPARVFWGRGAMLAPAAGLGLVTLVAAFRPGEYYWVMVAIPVIWLGALYGRHATVAGMTLLSAAFLIVQAAEVAAWPLDQVQRVLVATGTAALLLSARTDSAREQHFALSWTIETLEERGRALREAARRLSTERETESRRLGAELHDELGQDMTAIATRLRIAERHVGEAAPMLQELRTIQGMVETAHAHLRGVIQNLHPLALDRFGLARALSGGPIAEMVENADITYQCIVDVDQTRLPAEVATAVYRICQEAATNAVKHGCGGSITIRLTQSDNGDTQTLLLEVEDEAGNISGRINRAGHGLQGIRDRANALGADYAFNAKDGAPRHRLFLALDTPGPSRGRAAPG